MKSKIKVRKHVRKTKKGNVLVKQHYRNLKKPFKPMPKNVYHLAIETAVYIPSTIDKHKPITKKEFNKRIEKTRLKLSNLFGGYTSTQAIGGFISNNGKLIKEEVVKVTSFSTTKDYLKNRKKLEDWLLKKKKEWKQESIGYEYEGDLYYI